VFFDRVAPGVQASSVIIDDHYSAYQATRHLTESGRKRIAHFAGPQNLSISLNRKEGYLKALQHSNLDPDPSLVVEADNFEKARMAVLNFLQTGNLPDGIFAVNDITAIGAMKTLQKQGIRVPEDVAVVGFSDGRFSAITDPPLSSVDQHGYEMGIIATEMLLKQILEDVGNNSIETRVLRGDLIIRGSSKI